MNANGSYGTKFQAKAYPQAKIKFINPIHESQTVEQNALIDSGASGTMIPKSVVNDLGLTTNNFLAVVDYEGNTTGNKGVYAVKVELGTDVFVVRALETNGYAIIGRDILNKHTTTLKGIQQQWEII